MGRRSVSFATAIKGSLELIYKGGQYKVQVGDLKEIDLHLTPWGFKGELSFLVLSNQKEDKLLKPFTENDPITFNFEVETQVGSGETEQPVPLKLKGIVTSRAYYEDTSRLVHEKNAVVGRLYRIGISDHAAFYWRQHFPLALSVNSDLKTIFAEQAIEGITLTMDWDKVLGKKHPQILLSAGYQGPGSPSYYDFICWVAHSNNGFFLFDYSTGEYLLSDKRTDKEEPVSLFRTYVSDYVTHLPTIDYAKPSYTNGSAKDPSTQEGENKLQVTPIKRDQLTITQTPSAFSDYVSDQKKRFKQETASLEWGYLSLPVTWPLPGDLLKFEDKSWAKEAYPTGKTFRVYDVKVSARLPSGAPVRETYLEESGVFEMTFDVQAEPKEADTPRYPAFTAPTYPILIEGYVFSDKGNDDAETYSFAEDDDTKSRYYEVEIPSWKKLKVRVPYEPQQLNGQFYFPPYKKQRVLLAIQFDTASIVSYLDWRNYSSLPLDGQGNHLVLGQSEKSLTSIKHAYADNKPQLDIVRTLEKDTETISIGEGFILLHTVESK